MPRSGVDARMIEQGEETEAHYRKIVTPMVLPQVSDDDTDETWGMFLRNVGIGPAEINYQGVVLDGQLVEMSDAVNQMRVEGALGQDPKGSSLGLRNGSSLGVGDTKRLLQIDPTSLGEDAKAKFRQFIHDRIDIRFQWCSVYDECEDGRTQEGNAATRGETPIR